MIWSLSVAFADPVDDFGAAVDRMQAAVAAVHDATFKLHQQEWVDGSMQPAVAMDVRYRAPDSVFVVWANGQRVLWVPGANNGKMWVDPGRYLPTITMAPNAWLARRGQRHTVERVGLSVVAAQFASDTTKIRADARLRPTVNELPPSTLYGRPARCFDATMHRELDPSLYADQVEVCLDADTDLPLQFKSWELHDGRLLLVETYGYEDLKANVGLPDADFDPQAQGF